MSDQTRGIIFVVLVVAITFIWLKFFQPAPAPQKPGQPVSSQTAPAPSSGASPRASSAASSPEAQAPPKPVAIPTVQGSTEKTVVVESPLYRVELSSRGGVVRSWKL